MKTRVILCVAGLILAGLAGGCMFFGGNEPDYTHWEPDLSPDGRSLAFESPTEESLELFVRDLETNEDRQLTQNEDPDWSPSWSPTGDRIVFSSSRDDNVDIYVVTVENLSIDRLTTHEADDINPDWGIDGLVYFNSNRSGAWEIYTIDPGDKSLVKLTQVAEPSE